LTIEVINIQVLKIMSPDLMKCYIFEEKLESRMKEKPRMSFIQILNMSVGFFGIQYGFGLQNANVSRIFETMGAEVRLIPILWLAAPLTGLFVQPLVGMYSDGTWNRVGRRKPWFLLGALIASSGLLIMPSSSYLWMAAGALWMMDSAINMTMESFRAFVGDMVSEKQRNKAFALQSFIIGTGSVLASVMPWLLTGFGLSNVSHNGKIPESVAVSFYLGAFLFVITVLWTVFKTREYSPEQMEQFNEGKSNEKREVSFFRDIFSMPVLMKKLALVQFFTWTALFIMWIFMTSSTTRHVFGTTDTSSELYNQGANWVGICFAVYNGFGAIFSFILPWFASRFGRKMTHVFCLMAGSAGLVSVVFATDPWHMIPGMILLGIAWASLLSMPYAILSASLPSRKMGFYMGVFSFFISIPKIVTAAFLGFVMKEVFGGDPLWSILSAGGLMFIASVLMFRVKETSHD
jgi:maltose/moltooligosaccharide transporter